MEKHFEVKCDSELNTPDVVDKNELKAQIKMNLEYELGRRGRFELKTSTESKENVEKSHLVKSFKYNSAKKYLVIETYSYITGKLTNDIWKWQESPWLDWVENLSADEVITLTTYNGEGKKIKEYVFTNILVCGFEEEFDYTSKESSTVVINCTYGNLEKKFLYND